MTLSYPNIVTCAVVVWAVITLALNLVVPHSWFFTYDSLTAQPIVCQGETQAITGTRTAIISTPSSGVDYIMPVGINQPADRFEWTKGLYQRGESSNTWRVQINVEPGEYYWDSGVLKLNFLYIFPVYLGDAERPRSNTFTVVECK